MTILGEYHLHTRIKLMTKSLYDFIYIKYMIYINWLETIVATLPNKFTLADNECSYWTFLVLIRVTQSWFHTFGLGHCWWRFFFLKYSSCAALLIINHIITSSYRTQAIPIQKRSQIGQPWQIPNLTVKIMSKTEPVIFEAK